ncbi:response regulator [Desulfomarina sp.]
MPERILVVDDEPQFRDSIKRVLQNHGYSVDTVSSGGAVFTILSRQKYNLVLLDLHLPDLNGLEVAEYLTQNYPDLPTVILTGRASVDSAIQAIRIGCYDYLTKPCKPERVHQVIKRAIETQNLKAELTASRNKFQRLSEATWEGIVIFSMEEIIEVNNQFCRLLAVDERNVLGRDFFEILPALPLSEQFEIFSGGKSLNHVCEVEAIRFNGERFPAEIRLRQIDDDGRLLWVAAIRDLTEKKKHEQEHLRMQEKLDHARRMESIGLMAGSVAHDLNNILSSIVTFPELLLLDMPSSEKYRNDIIRIRAAGKQAAAVVEDLLTVARGSTCQKENHNLNDIIKDYLESLDYYQLIQSFPGIMIDFHLSPHLNNTLVSPIHITKVLINLIRNGAEAINNGGHIYLSTRKEILTEPKKGYDTVPPGTYAVLSVKDTGSGITASALPHIFEPFFSRKKLGKSGSGLGLTVILHTVRDHQGFIDVKSDSNGTLFELFFPANEEKSRRDTSAISLDSLLGNGEKILVIDDEQSQRDLTASILRRLGYNPVTATSGEEAIEYIKKQPVDLLLMDMVMEPGINGYETYKEILKIVPDQKAIVASGFFNPVELNKIRELGVIHYLAKPLNLSDLALAIHEEINK